MDTDSSKMTGDYIGQWKGEKPMETEAMREDQKREVALLLFAADAVMCDDAPTAETAMAYVRRVEWSLKLDGEWKDGRHEGDCTHQPFTCARCLIEMYEARAQRLWDADE